MYLTVWRASGASSFENGLSRTLTDGTGVPVFHPSPCVGGLIMHLLSGTNAINGLVWTRESPMPDENRDEWMFKMS